jgi:hypothetical protein
VLGFIMGLRILQSFECFESLLILSWPEHIRFDLLEPLLFTAETDRLVSDLLRI